MSENLRPAAEISQDEMFRLAAAVENMRPLLGEHEIVSIPVIDTGEKQTAAGMFHSLVFGQTGVFKLGGDIVEIKISGNSDSSIESPGTSMKSMEWAVSIISGPEDIDGAQMQHKKIFTITGEVLPEDTSPYYHASYQHKLYTRSGEEDDWQEVSGRSTTLNDGWVQACVEGVEDFNQLFADMFKEQARLSEFEDITGQSAGTFTIEKYHELQTILAGVRFSNKPSSSRREEHKLTQEGKPPVETAGYYHRDRLFAIYYAIGKLGSEAVCTVYDPENEQDVETFVVARQKYERGLRSTRNTQIIEVSTSDEVKKVIKEKFEKEDAFPTILTMRINNERQKDFWKEVFAVLPLPKPPQTQ